MERICKKYRKEGRHAISGIYIIKSLKYPNKYYVGSSENLYERYKSHFSHLKCRTSNHLKLQIHVDKYGIDDLKFIVIRECSIDYLMFWEQYYISEYNPYFNVQLFASVKGINCYEAKQSAINDILLEKSNLYNYFLVSDEYLIRALCNKNLFPENIISI